MDHGGPILTADGDAAASGTEKHAQVDLCMRALGVSGSFHILSKSRPQPPLLRSAVVSSRLVVGTTTTPQTPDPGLRLGISRCQLAIHNTSKLVSTK